MTERYTSELPAVPDPDFVTLREEGGPERTLEDVYRDDPSSIPEDLRYLFEAMLSEDKTPKVPDYYPRRYFEWSGAQSYIDAIAVYDSAGKLSIDQTSQRVGIPYTFDMISTGTNAEIVGLPGSDYEGDIEIHLAKDSRDRTAAFGHEIGHYFYRVVMRSTRAQYDRDEEDFCTYFGRAMAMPKSRLQEYETIDEQTLLDIMARFGVPLGTAVEQLMEYGMLPGRVAIDTYNGKTKNPDYSQRVTRGIYCQHCNSVGGDYNCPDAGKDALLFDFTDRAWGGQMPGCCGEKIHKPEILSTLTKYYMAREAQLVLFRPGALFEDD